MLSSVVDFLAILASWVYDINHAPALRRVRERDSLGKLRTYLPKGAAAEGLLAALESHVAQG